MGAVLGGCVQDMVIMFLLHPPRWPQPRPDGARRAGSGRRLGGAGGHHDDHDHPDRVLGLVIVNAHEAQPLGHGHGAAATIPVAMLIGIYMRGIRPGRVLEGSLIGIALLLLCVVGGGWVRTHNETLRTWFDLGGLTLRVVRDDLRLRRRGAAGVAAARAARLSVDLPEARYRVPAGGGHRDPGPGSQDAGAHAVRRRHRADLQAASLFPFVFITIACGAISGFHSLVSSGTTPKLLANERDIRMIGYGSMALESFVGIMAADRGDCVLDPGVYFAINSPAGVVGKAAADGSCQPSPSWGFPVTAEQMADARATRCGEKTLVRAHRRRAIARGGHGHASSARPLGARCSPIWYHFAIMFEVALHLHHAGCRYARRALHGAGSPASIVWKPIGHVSSWYPATVVASCIWSWQPGATSSTSA